MNLIWTNLSGPYLQHSLFLKKYNENLEAITNDINVTAIMDTIWPYSPHGIFFPFAINYRENDLLIIWEHSNICYNGSTDKWEILNNVSGEVLIMKNYVMHIVQVLEAKVFTGRIFLLYDQMDLLGQNRYKVLLANGGLYPAMAVDSESNVHIIWMDKYASLAHLSELLRHRKIPCRTERLQDFLLLLSEPSSPVPD